MNCNKNISRGCCFSRNENGEAQAQNSPGSHKMEVWDWLEGVPNPQPISDIYEIQFKNTRKGFYVNATETPLKKGDVVVVEAAPGHDVGIVSLTGDLVSRQMKRTGFNPQGLEFKKIIRKTKPFDIEKWQEAISMEHNTMIRSRQIAADLGLNMKIGDVEYQGDRLKAIFYYIADERVDFRELIKILAEQFRIRIEMRQIGARQEAGRIGGISACGRQLCCSTWQNNFSSVTIGAARHQEISLNPQKLAGQCGKLKCCLNYEVDTYIDARREFPRLSAPLEAMDGTYHLVKSDIFRRIMWFSPDPYSTSIQIPLGVDRVFKILAMNRKGVKVDKIEDVTLIKAESQEPEFKNVVGQESITRFDKTKSGNSSRNNNSRNRNNRPPRPENGDAQPPREARENRSPRQDNRRNDNQQPGIENADSSPSQESRANESRSGEQRQQRPPRGARSARVREDGQNRDVGQTGVAGQNRSPRGVSQNRQANQSREDGQGQDRATGQASGNQPQGGSMTSREPREPRENRPPRRQNNPNDINNNRQNSAPATPQTPSNDNPTANPNQQQRSRNRHRTPKPVTE